MAFYEKEVLQKAKQIDLLTYLQRANPHELIRDGPNSYHTRSHDSLKISNGKWMWWSRGIGGKTALDYLIKVLEMPFLDAVREITNLAPSANLNTDYLPKDNRRQGKTEPPCFILPRQNGSTEVVKRYLLQRGIHSELIDYCLRKGLLYQSYPYHNAVFIGRDASQTPRYAMERSTGEKRYFRECIGSDKRFSFSISGTNQTLHLFESAIDLLSYITLMKLKKAPIHGDHFLSLGGVTKEKTVPIALVDYLTRYPEISNLALHLDTDTTGRIATENITEVIKNNLCIRDLPPRHGKDMNDELAHYLRTKQQER